MLRDSAPETRSQMARSVLTDFIPSAAAPPRLTNEQIVGDKAPAEWGGLPVLGSYGPAYVISSTFVPRSYIAVVASAGPNAAGNPIGLRSHKNLAYQGLRIIPDETSATRSLSRSTAWASERAHGTGVAQL